MSNIETLLELRREELKLKSKISSVLPSAIDEMMQHYSKSESKTLHDESYKVTLKFVSKTPKPSEHQDLETLKELIDIESEIAIRENKSKIDILRVEAEAKLTLVEYLSQTAKGRELVSEYKALEASLVSVEPSIAIQFLGG